MEPLRVVSLDKTLLNDLYHIIWLKKEVAKRDMRSADVNLFPRARECEASDWTVGWTPLQLKGMALFKNLSWV